MMGKYGTNQVNAFKRINAFDEFRSWTITKWRKYWWERLI